MATHSSTLTWKIPWAEEPGGLQSMGSQRVGHDWSNLAAAAAAQGQGRLIWFGSWRRRIFSGKLKMRWSSTGSGIGIPGRRALGRLVYMRDGKKIKVANTYMISAAAASAKSLQSCLTLCDPIDGSPPGSALPGILQARTLEWVAISFFSAWKWKVKVKSLSHVWLFATPWTAAYQAPPSMGFSRQEYWSGVPLPSPGLIISQIISLFSDQIVTNDLVFFETLKQKNRLCFHWHFICF